MPRIAFVAVAAMLAASLATSAHAQTKETSCRPNFVGGGETCTTTTVQSPNPTPSLGMSQKDFTAQAARIAKWEEVCKPKLTYDQYGVARYVYANADCEVGLTGQ